MALPPGRSFSFMRSRSSASVTTSIYAPVPAASGFLIASSRGLIAGAIISDRTVHRILATILNESVVAGMLVLPRPVWVNRVDSGSAPSSQRGIKLTGTTTTRRSPPRRRARSPSSPCRFFCWAVSVQCSVTFGAR
jgi:hypothetical protein